MEGSKDPPQTNRIRLGPWDSWGVPGDAKGHALNLGARPQFENILLRAPPAEPGGMEGWSFI